MKVFGIEEVEGGVRIVLPSGRDRMIALPEETRRSAEAVGRCLLEALADEHEPSSTTVPATSPSATDELFAKLGTEAVGWCVRRLQKASVGGGRLR